MLMSPIELDSVQQHLQEEHHSLLAHKKIRKTGTREEHIPLKYVLILGLLTAFAPLSTDMYLPSLPAVSRDLAAPLSLTQITLTACILGMAFGQVLVGPISDAWGRRRPLLIGLAIYLMTSVLCIVAPSVSVLVALRFVQGISGAAGIVISLAIARDLYTGTALARCIALLMTVNFIAPIIAPVLGGQLLIFTSWRGVFGALALLGLVALGASTFGLRETLEKSRRQSSEIKATVRAFGNLLINRRLLGYALASSFAFAAGTIYISTAPFVLEGIYGLTPQLFGLIFGINAIGLAGMSQVSSRLIGRTSSQMLLVWGVGMLTAASLALPLVVIAGGGLVGVLPLLFVLVASLGLIAPNATARVLEVTDARSSGSASGLLGMLQFSIGSSLAPLVGLAGMGTALPMALAIALFSLASLTALLVLGRSPRR
jgi:MFS transporter, DHA1 family, multidrug resistance protein